MFLILSSGFHHHHQ